MTVVTVADVEFGEELPVFEPDTSLDNVRRFTKAAGWQGPRFTDHEAARKIRSLRRETPIPTGRSRPMEAQLQEPS